MNISKSISNTNENPCDKCIVQPMCQEGCEDLINMFVEIVKDFRPDYTPTFHPYFLPYITLLIKEGNYSEYTFIMCYTPKGDHFSFDGITVSCKMIIKNRKLVDIEALSS